MAGREKLLDPTGDGDRAADTTLTPRLRGIRGLTVGLLENTKPNSAALLAAVARELQRAHGLRASVMVTKSYFGTPAEESLIQRIARDRVVVEIQAGPEACADCLVPLPVMEAIMSDALAPTPYQLDHIVLPPKG